MLDFSKGLAALLIVVQNVRRRFKRICEGSIIAVSDFKFTNCRMLCEAERYDSPIMYY